MNQLKAIAKQHKGTRLFLVFSSILYALTVILQAYFLVTIVDAVFLQSASFTEIVPYLMGLLCALVARSALSYVNGRAGVKMATKVKQQFRQSLLKKYTRNPLQTSLQGQSGHKVSVFMDAIDEIDSYFSKYVPQVIQTSIVPLFIWIAVSMEHVSTGIIMIITAPFIPLFYIIIGIMTQKKSEEQMDKMALFSGRFLDTLQGLTTLKLFGKSKQQKDVIRQSSLDFRDATMEVLKVAFVSSLMLELISMLSIGIIALEVGIRLVVFESISFYTAFFVLVLAPEFYLSLKDLGTAFHTGRGSMGAATKIQEELEQEEHNVQWGEASVDNAFDSPPHISLDGVGFQYGEEGFALKSICTTIEPYEHVAIVGRSGAGKSTLLYLIAGLLPKTEGEIMVNHQPLSHYKEADWFERISYITQHPYIFAGTIRENIALGSNIAASTEQVERAAHKAGIADLIQSLEQGYDTPIGEGGRGLSGGEKQRIAIARAFLKQPSIVLFDEPTTGLDLYTEQILQQSINELSKNATVISVAHRLHTIRNADKILFLANGELANQGTDAQLMKASTDYANMVSVQQEGVER
ncbi:thiol reductant ABC exporter subunit CydD [Pontibacillus litoralis]|uniref:ABC transporter ATP-binding protein n=1 Tax=Pontibacillus litoralis JSM 072002 TaxID=1385512 RepID=A0A0A5G0I1_9BACI|nr:thiol reductant ABC exporter subunit CydD [Pontibacillus litoralis]KGX86611.1 ABC transporter ATP-binding protein [Pontibacillus litoralis JSM 072002]